MFVARRQDGSIYGTWTVRQNSDQEELPDDHADVVAFRERPMPTPSPSPMEQRLAALETEVAALKAARAPSR